MDQSHRRPIASRDLAFSHRITDFLVHLRVSANAISVSSAVFGVGAGLAYAATTASNARGLWLAGATLVLLRLLANMFDGMVAIQSRTSSAVGELYNEVPDRVSDTAILLGVGYAQGGSPVLGFMAALLALGTAYIRAIGKASGSPSEFCGPMAKQHRMAVIMGLSLVLTAAPQLATDGIRLPTYALGFITVLSAVTTVRRARRIAAALKAGNGTIDGGIDHG